MDNWILGMAVMAGIYLLVQFAVKLTTNDSVVQREREEAVLGAMFVWIPCCIVVLFVIAELTGNL